MFAGAEGRTCADLESGNGAIDCGDVPIVAGDEKPFSNPKLEGRRGAKGKFTNSASVKFLKETQGAKMRGVNLKFRSLANSFDYGGGEIDEGVGEGIKFQSVHWWSVSVGVEFEVRKGEWPLNPKDGKRGWATGGREWRRGGVGCRDE
jgi:hypothetical protein